jgi:hypothetical protein
MINLERMVDLPFSPKEVKDKEFALFIEDHIKRCRKNQAFIQGDELKEIQQKLDEYKSLLNEIRLITNQRKVNTQNIENSVNRFKEFARTIGNFLAFTYSKNSSEYLQIFPTGLSEISTFNYESIFDLMTRISEFLSRHQESEIFINLQSMFLNISEPLQLSLNNQSLFREKLAELTQNKNQLKFMLIRYFKRNIYSAFLKSFNTPSLIYNLFDQKIINRRMSNAKG